MSFNERVIEHVKKRKDKIHSWFMDMNLLFNYWNAGTRTYHHTAPTNALFALHEALLLIREEGLENVTFERMKGLMLQSVPRFQKVAGPAPGAGRVAAVEPPRTAAPTAAPLTR